MQIKIGNQNLTVIQDTVYFRINEILRERGYWFKFGVRDKIIDYCVKHAKRLEISFKEFPDIKFKLNPIEWLNLGVKRNQVGLFKNDPMRFYFFYVSTNGLLTAKRDKQANGQTNLLT